MGQVKLDAALAQSFGAKIRAARKAAGHSQQYLADALQLSRPAIANWETGRCLPSAQQLPQIHQILNIVLIEPTEPRPPTTLAISSETNTALIESLTKFVREHGTRGGRLDALLPENEQPELVADAMRLLDKLEVSR